MGALTQLLRRRKFPYRIVSVLSVFVGVYWFLQLPTNEHSRGTYMSENALMPGQVHTYFGGTESMIFRAYHHEVEALENATSTRRVEMLGKIMKDNGLEVGRQKYTYEASGEVYKGENVYSILQAPRGDATEAIVLCAGWRNAEGELNKAGVALTLSLGRYLKRWSLWSKDIIFLITEDSRAGPQAWVDAYHDMQSTSVEPLPVKSGVIQGAVAIDYPHKNFRAYHLMYDGINGQLPNLDLINSLIKIADNQMHVDVKLQEMWDHTDSYKDRLRTMARGMVNQALGHSSGAHSSFIPYHIDAITIQMTGENGWYNEVTIGRTLESICRSLNNLLEHFHQSFFFYLLMHPHRFVSIGTYLPSAMLIAINFTITAIGLWLESGQPKDKKEKDKNPKPEITESEKAALDTSVESSNKTTEIATPSNDEPLIVERQLLLPVTIVVAIHALGFLPLYLFNNLDKAALTPVFYAFTVFSSLLPPVISLALRPLAPTAQTFTLIKSFSLLLLGLFLSTLATINFSLSFVIGLLSVPFTFTRFLKAGIFERILFWGVIQVLSPMMALELVAKYWGLPVGDILMEAAFGWKVWGMWTQVVVFGVWWPAWIAAQVGVWSPLSGVQRD
ncbi:putative GPI transamidase component [Ascobolus immersus RN42]|uniref:Putative GPI transamidase component n=1 Tax=Ascobolus immersus RN42 TaxID=1160509 RepID=A0A3N4I3P8_ASCIM|nr:putative GPI transamidase component [Ascobolus immersus RN42]